MFDILNRSFRYSVCPWLFLSRDVHLDVDVGKKISKLLRSEGLGAIQNYQVRFWQNRKPLFRKPFDDVFRALSFHSHVVIFLDDMSYPKFSSQVYRQQKFELPLGSRDQPLCGVHRWYGT